MNDWGEVDEQSTIERNAIEAFNEKQALVHDDAGRNNWYRSFLKFRFYHW